MFPGPFGCALLVRTHAPRAVVGVAVMISLG